MYLFPESFTFLSSFFFVMRVINKCIIYLAFTTAGKFCDESAILNSLAL